MDRAGGLQDVILPRVEADQDSISLNARLNTGIAHVTKEGEALSELWARKEREYPRVFCASGMRPREAKA